MALSEYITKYIGRLAIEDIKHEQVEDVFKIIKDDFKGTEDEHVAFIIMCIKRNTISRQGNLLRSSVCPPIQWLQSNANSQKKKGTKVKIADASQIKDLEDPELIVNTLHYIQKGTGHLSPEMKIALEERWSRGRERCNSQIVNPQESRNIVLPTPNSVLFRDFLKICMEEKSYMILPEKEGMLETLTKSVKCLNRALEEQSFIGMISIKKNEIVPLVTQLYSLLTPYGVSCLDSILDGSILSRKEIQQLLVA